jgi:hypothetical protein
MANMYQDALTNQLTGKSRSRVNAPGFMAPGGMQLDPPTERPLPVPIAPEPGPGPMAPSGGSLQDILGKYQYGAKGLADAEGELTGAGYQLQKDSQGRQRGRLKGPTGDIIDVIGQGEGNDWWNNQTGSAWNINNRGQEGLDAGGWSFGGPSSDMLMPQTQLMLPPQQTDMKMLSPAGDNMADPNQRSPFLEALLAQLGGRT